MQKKIFGINEFSLNVKNLKLPTKTFGCIGIHIKYSTLSDNMAAGLSLYANLLDPSGSSSKTLGSHQSVGENQQATEASASKQQISAGSYQLSPM